MKAGHATKVAAVATAVIAVVYVVGVTVLNLVVSAHLAEQSDDRLAARLTLARHHPARLSQPVTRAGAGARVTPGADDDVDADGAPVFLWSLNAAGAVTARSPGAPPLAASLATGPQPHDGLAVTTGLGTAGAFRLRLARDGSGWLIAGQSLAGDAHTRRLLYAELITGPFLLLAIFFAALVDDMLWLARFDSKPPSPSSEPVDLVTLAQASADRFRAVGPVISTVAGPEPALISAPPESIDRLAGVLMDNACRYAGHGGQVKIGVRAQGSRVSLSVEDSGPGIPEAERPRLFDRFHRATEHGSGAGLGLAIGDSIVRWTGGRWHVGDSPLGGALMEVSWRPSQPHRLAAQRVMASDAR